jgi:hypothetical protein
MRSKFCCPSISSKASRSIGGGFAAALPPHEPPRLARHETAALLRRAVLGAVPSIEDEKPTVEEARLFDEREHEAARAEYETDFAQWERMRSLARRVLAGEPRAYSEAVWISNTLGILPGLGVLPLPPI